MTAVECPTCERDDFSSVKGMKIHHADAHGESIAGVEKTCERCGDPFRCEPGVADDRRFCSLKCKSQWMADEYSGEEHWSHAGRVAVECAWCDGKLEVTPTEADEKERHFCDRDHYAKWQSDSGSFKGESNPKWKGGPVEKECEQCGETYEAKQAVVDRTRFCSRECHAGWMEENLNGPNHPMSQQVELECASCGDTFHRSPANVSDGRNFCSVECYGQALSEENVGQDHPRWRGGEYPYGEGWNESKKEAVRERDGFKCRFCPTTQEEHLEEFGRKLDVHHITPAREFDDPEKRNAVENLVTVCLNCHGAVERMAPLLPAV